MNLLYSHLLSKSSCRWSTCGSSTIKDSFPSQGQEDALKSTRSSPLLEGRCHLAEGESLSQNSFGRLPRWSSRTLPARMCREGFSRQ